MAVLSYQYMPLMPSAHTFNVKYCNKSYINSERNSQTYYNNDTHAYKYPKIMLIRIICSNF